LHDNAAYDGWQPALGGEMKFVRRFASCILSLALLFGGAKAQSPAAQPQITFVQLTDAHLFDDDESSNFSALAWAISKINGLVASGTPIDFIVYTGDLGLRDLSFPAGACEIAPLKSNQASESRSLEWASNRLAGELDRLAVRKMYFIPGNNDLAGEQLGDIGRYRCFLSKLQKQLDNRPENKPSNRPLQLMSLEANSTFVTNGIRLLGLNNATLKNQRNYQPWCSEKPEIPVLPAISGACPQAQVDRLAQSLDAGAPTVVFTHIPYLKDPYPPRAKELPGGWDIPQTLRSEWEKAACKSNVIAIFTGHFHDSNRSTYGARSRQSLQLSECVSNKIWVAPPLAQRFQQGQAMPARGFLVITMTPKEVTGCSIHWLPGTNGASDNSANVSSCQ
jgi:hypothetical protein